MRRDNWLRLVSYKVWGSDFWGFAFFCINVWVVVHLRLGRRIVANLCFFVIGVIEDRAAFIVAAARFERCGGGGGVDVIVGPSLFQSTSSRAFRAGCNGHS